MNHFTQTHLFDESHSKAASLSQQMGADLREAMTASRNYDASLAKAQRISQAKNYVESNAEQINTNFDQAFPAYVAHRLDQSARDDLFAHPGDPKTLEKQQALAQDFIAAKREELIAQFGHDVQTKQVESFYQEQASHLSAQVSQLQGIYQKESEYLSHEAHAHHLGVDAQKVKTLQESTRHQIDSMAGKTVMERELLKENYARDEASTHQKIDLGKDTATNGVIPFHAVDNALESLHFKEKK